MATPTVEQLLNNLAPKVIDHNKCTTRSIYKIISQPLQKKRRLTHQDKQWFNLGNGQSFNDPIAAAEYLLQREYGESFLFKPDFHKPIFIPDEFTSNQYCKDSTALLDFNIEQEMEKTLLNLNEASPDFWFTAELESFLKTQQTSAEIDQKEFEKWILKIKVIYLMMKEIQPQNLPSNLPTKTPADFIKDCINKLKANIPTSNLISIFSNKKSYRKIAMEVKKSPPEDSRLRWLFNLQFADRGEKAERFLFDELYSLEGDDMLKETVILSSVNFLTDFDNKHHQEFDYLIFSWTRKLIIGVEVKRQLNDTRAFEQLDKYHSILEEKLSDQLGPGWHFFPVIYVEKEDSTRPPTDHYINMNTDIKEWLSDVMKLFPENLNPQSIEQLKKVLQLIVFTIHISKKDHPRPITSSYWVDYVCDVVDSLSNAHNIVFYSQQQLPLMSSNDPSCNKVFFLAGFGTGKTFLLQEKAILLSKIDKYKDGIYYVVCNGKRLHYFERKHELEQYGIKVICEMKDAVKNNNPKDLSHIKAIFFDEWDEIVERDIFSFSGHIVKKLRQRLLVEIPICWVAPSCSHRARDCSIYVRQNHLTDFKVVTLNLNFRNTKEIANKALSVAEKTFFKYANGLSKPPSIHPNGRKTDYVTSIDEAIFRTRLLTKKGILLVWDNLVNLQTKEKVKFYHKDRNNFADTDNPIDFLIEGNVLVTSRNYISGFEWPVVVYQLDEKNEEYIETHECNIVTRCTSMLFVVGENITSNAISLPFTQILSVLDISTTDNNLLERFKIYFKKYIFDHLKCFNRREWLQNLSPILKETIEQISQIKDEAIPFSLLQKLLLFLLTDLLKGEDLAISFAMRSWFIDFVERGYYTWIEKCFNFDRQLETCKEKSEEIKFLLESRIQE